MKAKISGQLNGFLDVSQVPVVVEVLKEKVEQEGKTCAYCGSRFTSNREEAKYCSPNCRQKAYLQRLKQEKEHQAQRNLFKRIRVWIADKLQALADRIR
jgi:tRNA(Ile2) C34 agmatinyltransferase TiaS